MTELSKQTAAKAPVQTGGRVQALTPQDSDQAFRLAQALAQAGEMVPETYRGAPMKIMAAIQKGSEIGLAPMQSLASIALVNGRPTIWGDALRAVVLRAGHFIDCQIEGEGDNRRAVATLTRKDGKKLERTFSVADAKHAQLWTKKGPWQQYPERMLVNRATAFAVRDGAADVLMGMDLREEVMDYGPDAATDITPRRARNAPIYEMPETPAIEAQEPADLIHEGQIVEYPTDDEIERAMAEASEEGARRERLAIQEDGA